MRVIDWYFCLKVCDVFCLLWCYILKYLFGFFRIYDYDFMIFINYICSVDIEGIREFFG